MALRSNLRAMRCLPSYYRSVLLGLTALVCGASCTPDTSRSDRVNSSFLRITAAEVARPNSGDGLRVLSHAATSHTVFLRRTAIRALGRLENPALLPEIAKHFDDPSPQVRASAIAAAAQAVWTTGGSDALDLLLPLVATESDPTVRGTLARSLGRLQLEGYDRTRAGRALVQLVGADAKEAPYPVALGVALGFESLVRRSGPEGAVSRGVERLRELAEYGNHRTLDLGPARVRSTALLTLGMLGQIDAPTIIQALSDNHPSVSATAVRFLDQVEPVHLPDLVRRGVVSASIPTILETLRFIGRQPVNDVYCEYLFAAAPQLPPEAPIQLPLSIRVIAIDQLVRPCPDTSGQVEILRQIASEPLEREGWQPAAHGLFALTSIAPERTGAELARHATSPNAFVRAWAARSAAVAGSGDVLRDLAGDPEPNVRTAALQGLTSLEPSAADPYLVDQLGSDDPQLLMTTARLLRARPALNSGPAALGAFERISAHERETWRDPRLALLELLTEVGTPEMSERLIPFLSDYDPLVAETVADMLGTWNERPYAANAAPLAPEPMPTREEMQAMRGGQVVLYMATGDTISITLLPYLAPTNAVRFWRLASEGYFDGLTFHRWAPNFVIQGGSPGANEYQGAGSFSRDEIGQVNHWRGFVGISTRGHDTGDAQIFVNLVDNVRLDYQYTIIGAVTQGIEAIDDVMEGAVIERAEVRPGR